MKPTDDFLAACDALADALQNIPEIVLLKAKQQNPWFELENIQKAINVWVPLLSHDKLTHWLQRYSHSAVPKKVAIIMAGNIPMVGLHDLLSVAASGNKALCKLSSDDKELMTYCIEVLNTALSVKAEIVERVNNADAIIATGSNNTAKIFESYFKETPRIIRKNRTSIAVLTGHETKEELERLGEDIFAYYGLGCRNISKIYVPEGYEFNSFFEAIFGYGNIVNHHKYANNYDYNKAIYLLGKEVFLDNNFLLLRRDDKALHSPLGVLFYSTYNTIDELKNILTEHDNEIQCAASKINLHFQRQVGLGNTQAPELWDYADGVDTLAFLEKLK